MRHSCDVQSKDASKVHVPVKKVVKKWVPKKIQHQVQAGAHGQVTLVVTHVGVHSEDEVGWRVDARRPNTQIRENITTRYPYS